MSEKKNVPKSTTAGVSEVSTEDIEAAVDAGGEIVGITADDEPLVEGPNSK